MIKTKKQMFIVIGSFLLVILLGTTTYAFFNYTRTGVASTIKTGRIYFNTNQTSTLSLTNVFPVASNSVGNDYTEDTLQIEVTGDTTYGNGIEYLVTAEEVNVETSTGKKVPMTLKVGVTDNLGTEDTDQDEIEYFTDRGSTTSMYKVLSESVLYDGQYLLVGYIAPGATGIDGTINIKAYLDNTRVAISDTYDGTESDNMGTTSNWVDNRVVLTTNEWNSLRTQGNELSFKVKVEANEGIWIDPATNPNSAGSIPTELKDNITEIHFIKETPIRMERRYDAATVKADMTDTTLNEGKVLAWQEDDKLYIASSGETYLPANSGYYFYGLSNVEVIDFENVNTSRVTNYSYMFGGCSSLVSVDLSNRGSSNVTYANEMFNGCTNLKDINLSNFNFGTAASSPLFYGLSKLENINLESAKMSSFTSLYTLFANLTELKNVSLKNTTYNNLTNMSNAFADSKKLESVDLSGMDTSNVTTMEKMFYNCNNLTQINLSGIDTSSVTNMSQMFEKCSSLTRIDLSNLNTSSVERMDWIFNACSSLEYVNMNGLGSNSLTAFSSPFSGCTSIKEIYMSGFNFGTRTSLYGLFPRYTNIEVIDLSNANTNNITDISYLFESLSSLNTVNLDNINTSNVTNMSGLFNGCTSLTSIDISSFNTSSVQYTSSMFNGCSNLVTIKVSNNFNVSTVTSSNSNYMFTGCTSIVGGQGTTYDSTHVDNAYAIVDEGSSNPGYLTLKTN